MTEIIDIESPKPFESFTLRYLEEWNKRASVRSKGRTRFQPEHLNKKLYLYPVKPYLSHPLVEKLGDDELRKYSYRAAADMLEMVSNFETQLVTDQCCKLANQGIGIPIPDTAKQVALTVGVDEVYHAFVANEFLIDLKNLSGISPSSIDLKDLLSSSTHPFNPLDISEMDYFKKNLPEELQRIGETVLLCIMENSFTEELFGITKGADLSNPFELYVREHVIDETRHMNFFRNLLKHIWSCLDENNKTLLGSVISSYFDAFHNLNSDSFKRYSELELQKLGLTRAQASEVYSDCTKYWPPLSKTEMPFLKSRFELLEFSGILDHKPTRNLLAANAWVKI